MADLSRAEFSIELLEAPFGADRAFVNLRGFMLRSQPETDVRRRVHLDHFRVSADVTEPLRAKESAEIQRIVAEVITHLAYDIRMVQDPLALLTLPNSSAESIVSSTQDIAGQELSLVQAFKLPRLRLGGVVMEDF